MYGYDVGVGRVGWEINTLYPCRFKKILLLKEYDFKWGFVYDRGLH
jgi:hypothetical protein